MKQNQNNDQTESDTFLREDSFSIHHQKSNNNSVTQNDTGNKMNNPGLKAQGISGTCR